MVFRTDVCSIRLLKFLTGVLVSKVNIVNSLLGGTYRRFFILGVYLCAQVRRQGYIYANPSPDDFEKRTSKNEGIALHV